MMRLSVFSALLGLVIVHAFPFNDLAEGHQNCLRGQAARADAACSALHRAFPGQVYSPGNVNYSIEADGTNVFPAHVDVLQC